MNNITISKHKIEGGKNILFFDKYINITLNYSLDYWNDYFDDNSKRHFFLLGRPTIEKDEWENFDNKPSFITRIIAKKFSEKSIEDFCSILNGGFTVVIADYVNKKLIIVRDKLGVYPVYFTKLDDLEDFQVSTHQDILAEYLDNNILDDTSIAEFLSQGYVMHPNTYYTKIKSMDNASYIICDFVKKNIIYKSYFDFVFNENTNYKIVLNNLVAALKKSVERRTVSHYKKTGVLLSGGGDSRMIVCNASSDVEGYTVYDTLNKEIRTAKEIASLLGIKHHLIKRDPNCNKNALKLAPKYTAGMAIGSSGTFLNLVGHKSIEDVDNILTGDYADWLLKDIAFNTKKRTVLGKKIPINKFSSFEYNFYGPNIKFNKLLDKILKRRIFNYPDNIKNNLNKLQFRRILPLSNEFTCDSRLTLQRTLPWDSVFVDNDVLKVVLEMPSSFKLNGRIYNDALGILCEKVKKIPHANTGVKIGTDINISTIIQLFSIMKKKFFKDDINTLYGEDSWGDAKQFILSDKNLQSEFYLIPEELKILINSLLGVDIFSYTIDEILDVDYHLFNNIMTIYYWLKNVNGFGRLI